MSNSEDIQHKASELKAERGDWLHATVKGAIAAVPFAGGIGAEFFELVIVPPLAKRRDELLTMIASGLSEVQGQIADFSGSNLSNNPQFISAVATAIPIGFRTHQREKLETLRNAVLNIALGVQPDENKQQIFLMLIDELTVDHLRILQYLDNPYAYLQQRGISYENEFGMQLLVRGFPQLAGQESYVEMIIATMNSRGLLTGDWPHAAAMNEVAALTPSAKEFLAFIKSPPDLDASADAGKAMD
jgi:hypothetical protein